MVTQAAHEKKVQASDTDSNYADLPAVSCSMEHGGDVLDDTVMAATYRSRIYGLRDYSFTMSMNYDAANLGIIDIRNGWINKALVYIQYLPDGTNGFMGVGTVESFNLSGDVGGLETLEVTIQSNGTAITAVP